MSTTVRLATSADVRALAELHVDAWRWAYRGLMPDALRATLQVDEREAMWRKALSVPSTATRVWLAEREGRLVGFAATGEPQEAGHPPRTGELYALYQREDVAGTGVGRALMERALADLRARGFERVLLWVLDTNARARRFYERAGFTPDGATKTESFGQWELHEVRYRADL